jgi:hypothetical protein
MNKEQTALCHELTRILGYSTFIKIGQRCTGKWAGTTDYSLVFDERTKLFISNGMNHFSESVKNYIRQLQIFEKYREAMFQTICKQVEKDNLIAEQEGLLPVKCISLNMNLASNLTSLWAYIPMEVAGHQFNFIETGFNSAIFKNELEKHFELKNACPIFTAGAVQKPTFIFSNVRFSHLDKLYKLYQI